MARDIFCDSGSCQRKAQFLLTVLSTGQTTAFCGAHFASVLQDTVIEFDADPTGGDAADPFGATVDPARIPLVAAVASEIADEIWANGQGVEPDELVARNDRGWNVTVATYDEATGDANGTVELEDIHLTMDELGIAVSIVADVVEGRAELPDVTQPQPAGGEPSNNEDETVDTEEGA